VTSGDPQLDQLRAAVSLAWAQYLTLAGGGPVTDYSVEGQSVQRSGPAQAAYQRWWELREALRRATPCDVSTPIRSFG
jgi:hypothetical protein